MEAWRVYWESRRDTPQIHQTHQQLDALHAPHHSSAAVTTVSMEGYDKEATAQCVQALIDSQDYGEAEMDQSIPSCVRLLPLAPSLTGFVSWSRQGDRITCDADKERGVAEWAIPPGATAQSARVLYTHGGAYEWYSSQVRGICVCAELSEL